MAASMLATTWQLPCVYRPALTPGAGQTKACHCKVSTVAALTLPLSVLRKASTLARRARCRFTEIPRPKDLKMGDESGIALLDFQLRAVPQEVTFVDAGTDSHEVAVGFICKWAVGLAKKANWHFEIYSTSPAEVMCRLQNFCDSPYEVPWLLEHFSSLDSIHALEREPSGDRCGVLLLDPTAEVPPIELFRRAHRSGKHLWLTRSCRERLSELQNVCDNNVRVWRDQEHIAKVKVCSVRNGLAGRGATRPFSVEL